MRCSRVGEGRPPLCRDHDEIATNPIDDVFDRLDDFTAQATNRAIQGLGALIVQLADRPRRPRPAPGPAPGQAPPKPAVEDPRDVLGFGPEVKLTKALIKERKRALAALCHPDKGGSTKALQRINAAAEKLLATVPA